MAENRTLIDIYWQKIPLETTKVGYPGQIPIRIRIEPALDRRVPGRFPHGHLPGF